MPTETEAKKDKKEKKEKKEKEKKEKKEKDKKEKKSLLGKSLSITNLRFDKLKNCS